ncbi:fungal specific transcription factor domain-containing protein [Pochonia chlamydosporia 170]|uniref:Fungal specific transcription factor domain-containing protein n=1 Tax=Pochonia chlamydosporia 170 TaxID=1380566 RepID=A0A179FH37_METCM|nr:fungal specific transcription factor domain-containing protein [Pochonia chlamydosporia 170]OAQ64925.1 fungal specific transcription factor domain-containing protein [Pochonia chlamydosporia 170]
MPDTTLPTSTHHPPGNDRPIRRRIAVDGRVRSGCLTCKARKKKCDGQSSSTDSRCKSCIRLGLVCEQRPLVRVPMRWRGKKTPRDESPPILSEGDGSFDHGSQITESGRDHGSTSVLRIRSLGQEPLSPLLGSQDDIERKLLKYFLQNVAPLCSLLEQGGNSWCSVFLPMAIIDPTLLRALYTYALTHFDACSSVNAVSPQARLTFENEVAQGVSNAITQNRVTESTVACALVFSTAVVTRGDTSSWLLHLLGAGHLVNHLGSQQLLRTSDGAFLLRYFAYHDIMAALSTGRRPGIEGVYWVQDAEETVDSADTFMGLAQHLFRHISDICVFVTDVADLDPLLEPERATREIERAEAIAYALRSQDLRLKIESKGKDVEPLVHHAEAVRSAALIHLYRHLLQLSDSRAEYEAFIEDEIGKIIHHVSSVPLNRFCELGLLFPLFMAGVACGNNTSTQEFVQSRLQYIETWTRFRHVTRARELLELLWGNGRMDWQNMLREINWQISLA